MKRVWCVGLICLLLLGLAACGAEQAVTAEMAAGVWKSEEIIDGSDWITYVYTFEEDGSFTAVKYVNGAVERVENSVWRIEEGKLLAGAAEFTLKDGKLISGGHPYTKQ